MKEDKNKHINELGFQVPQDYFKGFEEQMMTDLSLNQSLGKETGFQVPDGYFESLEQQLIPTIDDDNKVRKLTNTGVIKYLYPVLAVAAVLAVILSIGVNQEDPITLASVDSQELETYIEESYLYDNTALDLLYDDHELLDDVSITEDIELEDVYEEYYLEDIELNEIITE